MIQQVVDSTSIPPRALTSWSSIWDRLTQLVQRIRRGLQILFIRCQLEWLGIRLRKQRHFALQQDSIHFPEFQDYINKWCFYTNRSLTWIGLDIGPDGLPPETSSIKQLKTFYHHLKAFLDQTKT